MDEFNGIISLLVACIEFGLLVNLLIFAEKNRTNILIMLLCGLLLLYQILDFSFCFAGVESPFLIYIALLSFIFQPSLALFIVFIYNKIVSKILWLCFVPAIFILFNLMFAINEINIIGCNFFNAEYTYPSANLFGVFYFFPLSIMLVFLLIKLFNEPDPKEWRIKIFLLTGYGVVLFLGLIIVIFIPGAGDSYEGIFSKLSVFPAISFALLALKNRISVTNNGE